MVAPSSSGSRCKWKGPGNYGKHGQRGKGPKGQKALLGDFDAAGFANDGDADLAGVLEFVFDLGGDVAGKGEGLVVVDLFGLNEDAKFAAGLNGECFFDAGK